MKKKILFIDEEYASIKFYLQELERRQFDVQHARSAVDAIKWLEENPNGFALIILDSSMPPGPRYAGLKTDNGTVTGSFIFADIRSISPHTPVLILTNFRDLDWIKAVEVKKQASVEKKLDRMPSELGDIVESLTKTRH